MGNWFCIGVGAVIVGGLLASFGGGVGPLGERIGAENKTLAVIGMLLVVAGVGIVALEGFLYFHQARSAR
ncbi:hypothetical protein Cs7R123_44730 [Catellatospora sp. TT07R-123]|uniref:hypothetical protein n=1 Tax=Catellatospora sp. TT07R-123 TaxID=2733863 RepID=UPI001B1A5E64|nr:hypothetical protein [Catellatospora sp. TT07R-123]GHJ47131.1 hypothetical protein Cs7R123_44730 [Catellatospora sp. TT07R-123]